jgi:hypothetical protein
MIDKEKIIATRLSICRNCEHYTNENGYEQCLAITIKRHPTKRGALHHPMGVPNLRMKCPKDFWPAYFTEQIVKLKSLFPQVNEDFFYRLNKFNLSKVPTFQLLCQIRKEMTAPKPSFKTMEKGIEIAQSQPMDLIDIND